jgi:hypothetical protein
MLWIYLNNSIKNYEELLCIWAASGRWLGLAHPSGPAVSMGWQPTAEAGELTMALEWRRLRSILVTGGETGGGGGSGRMPAGWTLDLRRWETHQGLASMMVRSGGSKPTVLGDASHRGAWLAGRRAAQPQCPARGGAGRVERRPEAAVHVEALAAARAEGSRW